MKVSVLTLFPRLYDQFLEASLIGRARKNEVASVDTVDLFSFVSPGERIDAPTCGHGAGMLLRPDVIDDAIAVQEKKAGSAYKIFFSPQGKKLTQSALARVATRALQKGHLMLLPARYEGMDARVEQHFADEVFSVGDFVLMGGDLPAMMFLEGVFRFIPGVVGKQESVEQDSFSGPFLDHPAYTKPVSWRGMEVPEVVRSGDHAAINAWRKETAARNTVRENFDWFRSQPSTTGSSVPVPPSEMRDFKIISTGRASPKSPSLSMSSVSGGNDEMAPESMAIDPMDSLKLSSSVPARLSRPFASRNWGLPTINPPPSITKGGNGISEIEWFTVKCSRIPVPRSEVPLAPSVPKRIELDNVVVEL